MEFRIDFFGPTGLIASPSAGFNADDDETAVEIARGMHYAARWRDGGCELWQGARLVHTEG